LLPFNDVRIALDAELFVVAAVVLDMMERTTFSDGI
jgi:hypothetical protein